MRFGARRLIAVRRSGFTSMLVGHFLAAVVTSRPHLAHAQAGQATLVGQVVDQDSYPVGHASIGVVGQRIRTVVDDSGRFVLRGIAGGHVEVTARAIGFEFRDTTLTLDAGATVEWRVVMTSLQRRIAAGEAAIAAAGRVDSLALGGVATDTTLAFAYTAFGAALLRAAVAPPSSLDSNRILSPLGAGQLLAVALLGARDSTALAMAQTLGAGGLTVDALAARNRWFNEHVAGRRDLVLKLANALWVDTSAVLQPAFAETARREYGATARTLPLVSRQSVAAMNRWADSMTAGRIRQVRSEPFDTVVKVVLANAVYLKSLWLQPFDSAATTERPFTLPSGGRTMVPMMQRRGSLAYRRGEHFQVVRLPYKDGLTALYVVLPDSNRSALAVLDDIRAAGWSFPNPINETRDVHLSLPKMHVEQQTDLLPPLTAMGMGIAFDRYRADFSGVLVPRPDRPPPCPPLSKVGTRAGLICTVYRIAEINQHTYFDVDETGTEAAAITIASLVAQVTSVPPPPLEFLVDRPFLFALRDERTGTLLFVGYVARPFTR